MVENALSGGAAARASGVTPGSARSLPSPVEDAIIDTNDTQPYPFPSEGTVTLDMRWGV